MDILRYEFQKTNLLGFPDCEPVRFYESKWSSNRLAFLIYRVLMFLYTFAWIVADLATSNNYFLRNYGIFLTNWTEVAGCGHFFLSMLVVAYGYHVRKEDQNQQEQKLYHRIVWIFFMTALSAALATSIAFWILLASGVNTSLFLRDPFYIHEIVFVYLLLLIDLFVNDIPLRILHFIYPIGFGVTFTIFTVVFWAAGHRDPIYPGLSDWEYFPNQTALVTMLMTFVIIPVLHIMWHFWLFQLREWIAKRCLDREIRRQQPIDDNVEMNMKQVDGEANEAINDNDK